MTLSQLLKQYKMTKAKREMMKYMLNGVGGEIGDHFLQGEECLGMSEEGLRINLTKMV